MNVHRMAARQGREGRLRAHSLLMVASSLVCCTSRLSSSAIGVLALDALGVRGIGGFIVERGGLSRGLFLLALRRSAGGESSSASSPGRRWPCRLGGSRQQLGGLGALLGDCVMVTFRDFSCFEPVCEFEERPLYAARTTPQLLLQWTTPARQRRIMWLRLRVRSTWRRQLLCRRCRGAPDAARPRAPSDGVPNDASLPSAGS